MRLAFIRTLSGTFESDPRRIFGRAFRGTRGQRWPVGGKFIFTFKGTFISTFAFMIRTTAGTIRGRSRRSNRSSVVRKLGHVSRVATRGGAAFARDAGLFGVRAWACRRRVLWTSGRRLRRVSRLRRYCGRLGRSGRDDGRRWGEGSTW